MLNRFVIGLTVVILMGGTLFPLEPVQAQSSVNRQTQTQKPLTFFEKQTLQQHMNKALLNATNGWMDTLDQAGCTYNGATTYLKNPQCDPAMATDAKKKNDLEKIAKALFREMGAATSGRCGKKNPAQVHFSDFVCSGIVPHTQKPSVAVSSKIKIVSKILMPDLTDEKLRFNKIGAKSTIISTVFKRDHNFLMNIASCIECYFVIREPRVNVYVKSRYNSTLTVPDEVKQQGKDAVKNYIENVIDSPKKKVFLVHAIYAQTCTENRISGLCVYRYYDEEPGNVESSRVTENILGAGLILVTLAKCVHDKKGKDCVAFGLAVPLMVNKIHMSVKSSPRKEYNIVEKIFIK